MGLNDENVVVDAPDADSIPDGDAQPRELPNVRGLRRPGFQTVIKQSVRNEIHRHGVSVENTEICGVLVGNVYRDDKGPFLYIESSVRGEHASNESCNVTFTAETWNHIQQVMDREYPDRRILGWYHTHPGFGIFLSDMDLFIHRNFFNLPWQVAIVYDPQSGQEGLFQWHHGETKLASYLLERDEADVQRDETAKEAAATEGATWTPTWTVAPPASSNITATNTASVPVEPPRTSFWLTALLSLVVFFAAFAFGLFIFGKQ
jgi:proteasome lid subunit RPN8/RPN11